MVVNQRRVHPERLPGDPGVVGHVDLGIELHIGHVVQLVLVGELVDQSGADSLVGLERSVIDQGSHFALGLAASVGNRPDQLIELIGFPFAGFCNIEYVNHLFQQRVKNTPDKIALFSLGDFQIA